ncbi:NADP-dependent oxidoreductase [Pseudomonas sp. NPDC090203]|uniref:NADP-dependent oxidoreductase n=1 Tax=Pseudomonas sp. NPDC090203 TaxID=3364477 RepID=UPI0037FA97C7
MNEANATASGQPFMEVPATTLAARVHQFGGPECICVETVPTPSPGPGQVLVQVEAAGVGPWDGWIRSGNSALPQPLPLTLGSDLAGVVVAVGPEVATLKVGDAVFGVTNSNFTGAYAHYALAQASMIAIKPDALTAVQAASVPVIAVTAWQALFDKGHLKPGQTVLIHGGAGGVGAYAIQFAKNAGAQVITTASAKDQDYVRGLGADRVIDYKNEPFETTVKDIDLVVDLVGGDAQDKSFSVLKPGGFLVSAVSNPDQDAAVRHGVTAFFFLVDVTTDALTEIATLVNAGKLTTRVGPVFDLDQATQIHEILDGKRPRPDGKMIIKMR